MTRFTTLGSLAQVSLGYKSLQNDFYYLNQATISSFGIEGKFLEPIFMLDHLSSGTFRQDAEPSLWIFVCRGKESDLRGTGALRYIHAMSERPAAKKKQSSGSKTIREVLEAQGGGLWYVPKAKPHASRLWLRKAINTVYAPFIFDTNAIVDQRCNYVDTINGLPWELVGAVTSSTLFAYSLEVNGGSSMGAGALEAPTSKLRAYPVFDARTLNKKEQQELIRLARALWNSGRPTDWQNSDTPCAELVALDTWLLERAGSSVSTTQLYADLKATCASRLAVAQDKKRTTKKQKSENVGSVAKGIAEQLERQVNARQFPENFYEESGRDIPVHVDRQLLRAVKLEALFDQGHIQVTGVSGKVLFEARGHITVTELIARALLMGRETFTAPQKREQAEEALGSFFEWFDGLRVRLDQAINESALGTGYEDILRAMVYQRLRIHLLVAERALPGTINLGPPID